MTVEDVIHDFAVAENDLPRDSMRWALDNWDAALPRFREMLALRRRRRSQQGNCGRAVLHHPPYRRKT
jgi:hypothetical protein